jgi:signal transduction histidine kinase
MKPLRARPDWGVWSDLAAVATLTIGTAWLSARFEWMETLYIWTRAREQFQLDELIPVLLVLAAGLVWFAARRYRQARRAADARRAAQAELAQALAAQCRLAQQVVRLQEDERKSLARELHDETGQYLNAIKLDAVTVRDAGGDVPDAVRERARAIVRGVDHVQASVSSLIRQLRPVGLDELGLAAAVEHCVNGWRARLAATRFEVSIDPGIDALDEACSLAIYRLVQEAMTNCARHAHASCVDIRLACAPSPDASPGEVSLEIRDNGVGSAPAPPQGAPTGGLGLAGMRERIAALGGCLQVQSEPGGFRLSARIPRGREVAQVP